MRNQKSISVSHSGTEVSVNEAAELLNFSKPYVLKLLNEGEIPFRKVGSHRRISFTDVLIYRKKFKKVQREALTFLVQQSQDLKLGYQ